MVIHGARSTLGVTVADIAYHTRNVRAGLKRALLMADLPFMSYANEARALESGHALVGAAGADMVKLEGGDAHTLSIIALLSAREVPVCAHLGLTPQSVLRLGGYKVQGREQAAHDAILAAARAVADAGAAAVVLECVPGDLAREITASIPIPTIGIGAGVDCDGQVLVMHDMLGMNLGRRPRFVKDFLAGAGSVLGAFESYAAAVRARAFPGAEHSY
jgi:3-methyl-2-oxobutanoate hydroxymethyltransferase